jgi:hypothetical protein
MPYDPMGSGYGRYSRGKGEYGMQSIYGYGDQGPLYNPQNPNPAPSPSAMTPNAGMTQINPQGDFFSQLAGLMGGGVLGGAASNPRQFGGTPYQNVAPGNESRAYANTLPPAQYNDYMSKYSNRDNIASAGQNAPRQNPMNMGRAGNGMGRTREQGAKPIQMTYGSGNTPEFEAAQAARDERNRAARAASGEGRQGFDQFAARNPQRPANNMPKPGRPMAAPPGRAPGLMAGNSPMLGEKNPLGNMPAPRRAPRASGGASMGRTSPSRANFNYQMGGNG